MDDDDLECIVPEVSMAYFQDALLPPLRPELADVAQILSRLADADGHRATFSVAPTDTDACDSEEIVSRAFQDVAAAVHAAVLGMLPKGVRATALFACNPDMQPVSEVRRSASMPDSYARLIDPPVPRVGTATHWEDVAVPGEMKRRRTWDMINDVSFTTCSVFYRMYVLTNAYTEQPEDHVVHAPCDAG